MKINKKDDCVNYSKRLARLIDEGSKLIGMPEYDSSEVPSSQLSLALFGAQSPVQAAEIAMRYCGNDLEKAYNVVHDMIGTTNSAQQGYLVKVLQVIRDFGEKKSLPG